MSNKEHDITRRQFLNYTLTGVGGFMAAGIMMPMVRFAIDPLLKPKEKGHYIQVTTVDKITDTPKRYDWSVDKVDGWHKYKEPKMAFIYKLNGKIIALSPICTHLGCTVGWNNDPAYPNEFHCPCHGGRYTRAGINIPGTPPTAPLHEYDMKINNGAILLADAHPRKGA